MMTKLLFAESSFQSYELIQQDPPIYQRGSSPRILSTAFSSLKLALPEVLSSSFFASRIPAQWGILLDGTWTQSSGFFSDQLKTPEGAPAILLSPSAILGTGSAESLLAHELTHLVHQGNRPQEESWVREGVALLAEWTVTKRYSPALTEAFARPETSLTAPLDPRHLDYADVSKRTAQYGHILQYFIYIYRLCGKQALLDTLLTSPSPKSGIAFLDEVLPSMKSASPACANFKDSFRLFSLARFQQDVANPENYVLISGLSSVVRAQAPDSLPPYSSSAYSLQDGAHCAAQDIAWGTSRCIRIQQ